MLVPLFERDPVDYGVLCGCELTSRACYRHARPLEQYVQEYAKTKAMGEMALTAACSNKLMTVAIAPHQVPPSNTPFTSTPPCLFCQALPF